MKQVTNLFRTWIAAAVAVLAFPAVAQTTLTIGSGSATNGNVPIMAGYDFSYGQSIYTPQELSIPA